MIFDNDYDKVLWLMLYSDVKSRKIVIDFINSIPSSLFEFIIDGLKKRSDNNKLGLFKEVDEGNYKYSFKINSDTGELFISRYLIIKGNFEDVFMLKILPYESVDRVKKTSLGSVIYMYRNHDNPYVWECDKVDYDVRNISSKLIVSVNRDYDVGIRTKYRIIDKSKIPNEVNFKNLQNKESVKEFMRKKKKTGAVLIDGGNL